MTWPMNNTDLGVPDTYSTLQVLFLFVGLPLLFILVVSLLVLGPSWTRAGRSRPGQGWETEPVMIDAAGSAQAPAADAPTDGEDHGSSAGW